MPSDPLLAITQDLQITNPSAKTSPATLRHAGLLREITLNGTFDGKSLLFEIIQDEL